MAGRKVHFRGVTRHLGFNPTLDAYTPAITWLQTGEAKLGSRRGKVISSVPRKSKKVGRHNAANHVQPSIFRTRVATPISEKPG